MDTVYDFWFNRQSNVSIIKITNTCRAHRNFLKTLCYLNVNLEKQGTHLVLCWWIFVDLPQGFKWGLTLINKLSCSGGLLNEINSCTEYATYQTLLSLFLFLCFKRLVSTNWRSALLHALGGCKAMIIRVRFAMLYTTGGKSKKPWWWCSVWVNGGSFNSIILPSHPKTEFSS